MMVSHLPPTHLLNSLNEMQSAVQQGLCRLYLYPLLFNLSSCSLDLEPRQSCNDSYTVTTRDLIHHLWLVWLGVSK